MIEIFDTTLRDGTQAEHVSISAADKIRIAQKLDRFGIDVIEGGWPGSNPRDQEFFERARDVEWTHAQICAFGSTRRTGVAPEADANLKAMIDAGTKTVSLFGKSWTLHARVALGVDLEENLDLIRSSVEYLKANGKRVIYDAEHFFDGYRADPAYALATLAAADDAGADVLVLCDTNGGTLPSDVDEIVQVVARTVGTTIGAHMHNDGACAVANTLMAVRAGARHVQGTINGIGERCGNADLTGVIPGLQIKMGMSCIPEESLGRLADLSRFVFEVANLDPNDRAPYVGRSAFAHKGGIHVSAVMKDPKAYEHVEPEIVGNARRVLVSDLSGRSNVRYKAAELGYELGSQEQARLATERIKALEHLGYSFEGAEASFELLLRSIGGEDDRHFAVERLRVRTDVEKDGCACAEATLVLVVGGQRELVGGEGVGPVDAMSIALKKALEGFYPQLTSVRLSDYKVRVLTPEEGTAATVRVLVEHTDGHRSWSTVGVSDDIITASMRAVMDGYRYRLIESGAAPVERATAPGGTGQALEKAIA